jgi:hypothetical protein
MLFAYCPIFYAYMYLNFTPLIFSIFTSPIFTFHPTLHTFAHLSLICPTYISTHLFCSHLHLPYIHLQAFASPIYSPPSSFPSHISCPPTYILTPHDLHSQAFALHLLYLHLYSHPIYIHPILHLPYTHPHYSPSLYPFVPYINSHLRLFHYFSLTLHNLPSYSPKSSSPYIFISCSLCSPHMLLTLHYFASSFCILYILFVSHKFAPKSSSPIYSPCIHWHPSILLPIYSLPIHYFCTHILLPIYIRSLYSFLPIVPSPSLHSSHTIRSLYCFTFHITSHSHMFRSLISCSP